MVNFGILAPEIVSLVWDTPANFNGFRVLAALLHGTVVVGVSQTLWRWTEGVTYIRQGGHHVGHWPTFLVSLFVNFSCCYFHGRLLRYVTWCLDALCDRADNCRYNVEVDYNADKLDCNCPQPCEWVGPTCLNVQSLVYIGWNEVTYLWSQYDRYFVGQQRRTVRR